MQRRRHTGKTPWRREKAAPSIRLPEKPHGQRSLAGRDSNSARRWFHQGPPLPSPREQGLPAPGREGPLRLPRPLPLHCPHAQVTPEASSPQPGVQMRTPRGQQAGSCPWSPMGGPVPAAFCTPGSPVPRVPRLPPAQKDLREQKLFPRTRSTLGHGRGSKASRLSCNVMGPRGPPRLSTPSTGSPLLGRSLILAPGAQSGGHRTPDPVFPKPL